MICKSCGKELPDEIEFCPYCMTKFTNEKNIENITANPCKKILLIISVVVIFIAVITTVVIALNRDNWNKTDSVANSDEVTSSVSATQSTTKNTSTSMSTELTSESQKAEINITESTITTSAKSTKTTTTTRNMQDKKAILNAYVSQMLDTLDLNSYYIYDVDKNGVYELITMTGTYQGDFTYHFYTYKNGKVEYIDSDSARYRVLYVPLSGDGLLNIYTRQEWLEITEITLNGMVFSTEKLFETEIGYDEDYWQYEKDYASGELIGCDSYDPTYAEYIFNYGYDKGSGKWVAENLS